MIPKPVEIIKSEWIKAEIRPKRDKLLDECDLKQCNALSIRSMSDKKVQEWEAYKQALRDLPETIDPENPVWPEMPV